MLKYVYKTNLNISKTFEIKMRLKALQKIILVFSFSFMVLSPLQAQQDSTAWASSLWLNWQDQSSERVDMFMVDFWVDSSAKSTYYAALNFTGGYAGVQDVQSGDKYRTVHFSLWDKQDGVQKAEVVWKDFGIGSSRFGGEGDGVKAWYRFNWHEKEPYRMVVKLWNSADSSYRDAWFYDFKTDKWKHIAILRRPGQEYFQNNGSFIEDWAKTGFAYRAYTIFNMRKRYLRSKKWLDYSKAEYWVNGINPNCNATVVDNHKILLESGGTILPPRTPSLSILQLDPTNIKVEGPRIETIEVVKKSGTSIDVSWDYKENLWAAQETCRLRIAEDENFINTIYESGLQRFSKNKFEIKGVQLDSTRSYYLRLDIKSIFDFSSKIVVPIKNGQITAIERAQSAVLLQNFTLNQNYPNPFNPQTTISFQLRRGAHINLDIFDIKGVKIRALINEPRPAGSYNVNWNGYNSNGRKAASGIYLYKMTAGNKTFVRRMLLLK